MRIGRNSNGYTLMEVLIFVAISGFMFTVAATAISGKQGNAEFKQGLNDMNVALRDVINDVDNGTYPPLTGVTCSADSIGSAGPVLSPGSAPQGTNIGCIFMGKAVQFDTPSSNDQGYAVYTVAGRHYVTSPEDGTEVTSFTDAKPRVLTNTVAPGMTAAANLHWGLTFKHAKSSGTDISGVAFYKTFGSYDAGGAGLQSGSQNVIAIPIAGPLGESVDSMASRILNSSTDMALTANPNINITLCFQGNANQYGAIIIGGENGQRLTTRTRTSNTDNLCG